MLSKLGSKAVEGLKFVSNSGGSLALELSNGGMFSNGGIDDVDESNGWGAGLSGNSREKLIESCNTSGGGFQDSFWLLEGKGSVK